MSVSAFTKPGPPLPPALERPLHGGDADLHRRLELVVAECLELLAARDGLLELRGTQERVPDLLARHRDVVRAFDLHPGPSSGGLVYSNSRIAALMRASPSR